MLWQMGTVISHAAKERIASMVDASVQEGAKVLIGGDSPGKVLSSTVWVLVVSCPWSSLAQSQREGLLLLSYSHCC